MIKKTLGILTAALLLAVIIIPSAPAFALDDRAEFNQSDLLSGPGGTGVTLEVEVDGCNLTLVINGKGTAARPDGGEYTPGLAFAVGYQPEYKLTPEDGWRLSRVTLNGADITHLADANGLIKLPPLTEDCVLNVVFELIEQPSQPPASSEIPESSESSVAAESETASSSSSAAPPAPPVNPGPTPILGDGFTIVCGALSLSALLLMFFLIFKRKRERDEKECEIKN